METNDKLKTALLQEMEKELVKLFDDLQTVKEGDLQNLEKMVLSASLSLGRTMIEQVLNHVGEETERPERSGRGMWS
jgi:hypothetical protein